MVSPSIRKIAFGLIHERLAELGFQPRRLGILSCDLADDVIGWLGLNTATRGQKGVIEVNPVVGIRHQRIERLLAELMAEPFDDLVPPTIAGNVGYLSPPHRYLTFTFGVALCNNQISDQLAEAINRHALTFMKKIINLDALVQAMQENPPLGMVEQLQYRLPIALWLLGDTQHAKNSLGRSIAKMEPRSDPAATRYRAFAAALFDRI